jgi:hypothetical protein
MQVLIIIGVLLAVVHLYRAKHTVKAFNQTLIKMHLKLNEKTLKACA